MSSLHKPFSHIYIEEDVREVERTQQILERFPKAILVPIDHYKEVFNRNNQNFRFQKNSPQLILAKRRGEFFYPGSTIAPDFGASRFYYNTVVLNCLYDCEYCYLQGMFPSAHLVAFVNNEDFIEAIRAELRGKQSIYLCLSYDTDLLQALREASSPSWAAKSEDKAAPRDLFLLSDGAATWGEANLHLITKSLASIGKRSLFAYKTGRAGEATSALETLARSSGGAVFSVASEEEIASAATAHRQRPWRLEAFNVTGGSDVLIAGRPSAIYP
ncbi:MAG: hypothetical protein KDD70_09200, partial [Bdellovibrionales bacterium]|nr:hypothetical protein [Bdellovibrionales bacterium]